VPANGEAGSDWGLRAASRGAQCQALAARACGKVLPLEAGDGRHEWPEKRAKGRATRFAQSASLWLT